ncbi:hypothetical protein [Phenylobacterium sp.]|uniref:hypothetical protein n=1 Tax=Phenylobacterium sp. TaxID=1871053 RepID=UPI0025DFF6E3|nr:hypothetical protein [Phenylobacterium sp.]
MVERAKPSEPQPKDTLSVEVGDWFKANATGRGVLVIGVVLVLLALVGLAQLWVSLVS